MEASVGLVVALLKNLVPRLFSLAEKKYNLYKRFPGVVTYLVNKVPYIAAALQQLGQNGQLVEELNQLAHDIEDCIDHTNYRELQKEQGMLVNSRNGKSIEELDKEMVRLKTEVQRLQPIIDDALKKEMDRLLMPNASGTPHRQSSLDRLVLPEELFGMKVPMKELREQLIEGEPKQLKVISIVGFCGLGKTILAHELYESLDGKKFKERAWVSAAHGDSRELLREILRQLQMPPQETSDVLQLSVDLRDHLGNKKYFIVIDDMRTDLWNTIKSSFPSNDSSRIVVTTRFQSVATICSRSTNGYIHKIGRLNQEHSKLLFQQKACPMEDLNYPEQDSADILKKCDGQPLALTTVGEFMKKEGLPKGHVCQKACDLLRFHLHSDHTLKRLYDLLINDYTSLPTHDHKACLLYFAMFPSDHPIRTKKLMRRWFAEGLLKSSNSGCDPAVENLKILMDHNIIQPINVSNNTDVRTCRTYGMMHEYITLMSHSENTNALFGDGSFQPKRVRRVSLRDSIITDANLEHKLPLVRSLIVIGNADNAMLDFNKYQLLKVLDLEQCTNMQNEKHLHELCNLLLLRYLSLGAGVTKLPKKIKQLKLLETLDLRKSDVRILRPEVIKLPNLVHLFGKKLKLQKKVVLASGQCKLQTLAGFLVEESKEFAELMSQMKKLRKVKIWCESSVTYTNLQEAIQNFIDDVDKSANDPRSLSIHFEGCSEDLLEGLHGSCYLASLKLHGQLLKLPRFVKELRGLTELCLQSATKFTDDLLTALCDLKYLKYLKLIAKEIDEIIIEDGKLRTLLWVCYVLECPTFPKIEEGAMPNLESLQLLCKDVDGLSDIQIKCFTHLKEVILDDRVTNDTKLTWVKVAKEHPNRPKVLLLKRLDPPGNDRGEDSAFPGATENEIIGCPVLPEEPVQDTDSQMTPGEANSAIYDTTGPPVVFAALPGLSISGNDPMAY
ncbi:disease resistance protein RPP13-like [Panicum miliaceum]|uniref:Disease resistance protein RPP13-like n=1 Tax=Panicum miliaceum TaxID=4540 RepID=A0A3L6Q3J8_PANMI|nr:disease resistance protein RPP13-like [Panicum miliaceum]